MPILSDPERELLERIAAEGKATRLLDEEVAFAKELETAGLLFLVGAYAVITPKGRRLLADLANEASRSRRSVLHGIATGAL